MRVLFLNPPHGKSIMRRYGCSYNSPGYLFQPLELCSAATALRQWNDAEVMVLDAIAETLNLEKTIERTRTFQPELIVFITGFDSLKDDLDAMNQIKNSTGAEVACFGYLPTLFPEELMKGSTVDFVIMGEIEITLSELVQGIKKPKGMKKIRGLAWRDGKEIVINAQRPRMKGLDSLPMPDRGLLKNELYRMPFFGRPFTTIQTSRGCPFACTYCTHFEGKELATRSVDKVIEEIKDIVSRGIRHIRFMDNNFTFPPQRAKDMCARIIEDGIDIEWACLSRIDLLDNDLIGLMRKAGCKTIFLGIESGSDKTLRLYKKNYTIRQIRERVGQLKGSGIETIGWFILGAPWETESDFQKCLRLAKSLDLDYAIASTLSYFPGTELFESSEDLQFSLLPFSVEHKNDRQQKAVVWEKRFYRGFYMRPTAALRLAKRMALHPDDGWNSLKGMLEYIYKGQDDLF